MLVVRTTDGNERCGAARERSHSREAHAKTCHRVRRTRGAGRPQPLTAPIVSPFTTYFWKIIVRTIAGAMIATAAAITPPQSTSA